VHVLASADGDRGTARHELDRLLGDATIPWKRPDPRADAAYS